MSEETLAQYQWKFRNNALSGAQEHSIGMNPVRDALTKLGLTTDLFPLGPGVQINIADEVPQDTVVYVGDPDVVREYGVFRRNDRAQWEYIFGRTNYPLNTLTVAVWPGITEPPAWFTAEPREDEAVRIKKFMARAYHAGAKVRSRTSWCGAYENVMARVGVTAEAVRGINASVTGDAPSQVETVTLPEGTILAWVDPDQAARWALYKRDNHAQNGTRTIRITGNRTEGGTPLNNWRAGCRVIWMPGDEDGWEWRIRDRQTTEFLGATPSGTRFLYGGERYHKTTDGRIGAGHQVLSTGPWVIGESFNGVPITVIGIEGIG